MREYLLLILLLVGCVQTEISGYVPLERETEEVSTSAEIITEDGLSLAFDEYEGGLGIILVHMLRGDKESWGQFPAVLWAKGYHVLVIDLRGHGASPLDQKDFSSEEWNEATRDIGAAVSYLRAKGKEDIVIIGASIGANLALNYAAEDKSITKIVLLSPGEDYKGILTTDANLAYKNSVLFVASADDSYSYRSTLDLFEKSSADAEIIPLENAGHGIGMLNVVANRVIKYLE